MGRGFRRFETPIAGPVAQLDRALASEARGHRFESCRDRQPLLATPIHAFLVGGNLLKSPTDC